MGNGARAVNVRVDHSYTKMERNLMKTRSYKLAIVGTFLTSSCLASAAYSGTAFANLNKDAAKRVENPGASATTGMAVNDVPAVVEIRLERPHVPRRASIKHPTVIRNEEELLNAISDMKTRISVKKQVNFEKQKLLLFQWWGSGRDKLIPENSKSATYRERTPLIVINYVKGYTRDYRPHAQLFAITRDAALRIEKTPRSSNSSGTKATERVETEKWMGNSTTAPTLTLHQALPINSQAYEHQYLGCLRLGIKRVKLRLTL